MIEAKAEWKMNYQVGVRVRQFEINTDEPPKYKGEDTGMMPTELFISSLASCFCLALVFVAKKYNVNINDMKVSVSAEADNANCRYKRIIVKVMSSIPESKLEELIEQAKKYCYVTNTISKPFTIEYGIGD